MQKIILVNNLSYNYINFRGAKFYYDKNINYSYDENKKEFNIYQLEPGSRALFMNGSLEDLTINFYGNFQNKKFNNSPPNYPIDLNSLTGCLSLINVSLKDVSLSSQNSTCKTLLILLMYPAQLKKFI